MSYDGHPGVYVEDSGFYFTAYSFLNQQKGETKLKQEQTKCEFRRILAAPLFFFLTVQSSQIQCQNIRNLNY